MMLIKKSNMLSIVLTSLFALSIILPGCAENNIKETVSTAKGEGLDNPQAGRPLGRTREPRLSAAEVRERAEATRLRLEQVSGDIQRTFNIPDSGQSRCYTNEDEIVCPEEGEAFFGQDSQYSTNPMSFTDNGDGTITDNITGLMWEQGINSGKLPLD
ncbi:MAG: hypothetical protein OQK82_05685, partial [Candidatus Pacearchaeota archaeon]|nr:hypothetical protein [Candidatus Pacearchaeota archaeon]